MCAAADTCNPSAAQRLYAGAPHERQTIYLGTEAGSVHAVTVGYPADALRDGGIDAADRLMSQDQYKLLGNLYQAVRVQALRSCLPMLVTRLRGRSGSKVCIDVR